MKNSYILIIELFILFITLQALELEKEKQEVTHQGALQDIIEKHAKEQHDLGKSTRHTKHHGSACTFHHDLTAATCLHVHIRPGLYSVQE